ncbi:MAG: hypothetical protein AB9919_10265 [Geobacteraceae bacterium]
MMNFAPYILPVALTVVLLVLMRLQANSAKKTLRMMEEQLNALEQKLASVESALTEEIRKSGNEKDLKIAHLHENLRSALHSFMETTNKKLAENEAAVKAQNEQVIEKVTGLLRQTVRKPEQKTEAPPAQRSSVSQLHEKAKRLARLIVSDIVLYNQAAVEEGIRNDNFFETMSHDVQEARNLYVSRVPEEIRKDTTYLDDAFNDLIERKKRELTST